MLKFMSKYLSRNTLNRLFQLHVLCQDYDNVIYHIPQRDACSGNYLMEKFESVKYSAALAVSGTCKGPSRKSFTTNLDGSH